MKKTIFLVIAIFMIASCNKPFVDLYSDSPTRFIIKDIYGHDGLNVMAIYDVEIVNPNGLARSNNGGNIMFSFTDSIGKYNVGDIVNFKNKNIR